MEAILSFITTLFVFSVVNGTPLLYGTLGETLTEKSGNLNLGVEGIMFMGGAAGLCGAFYYEKFAGVGTASPVMALIVAILCAFLAGGVASLIFSFLTITLRANQNVTGLALTIFGTGVGQFMGEFVRLRDGDGGFISLSNNLKAIFVNSPFPKFLKEIPVLGPILFQHSILFYLGVLLAIGMWFFLSKTRKGLYLRSVGENPSTADAVGINVTRYKYMASCIGSGIAGLGGFYYIIDYMASQEAYLSLEIFGWLSIALVIFALWRPHMTIIGSTMFGFLFSCSSYIANIEGINVTMAAKPLLKMLPYLFTIAVLVFTSIRKKREDQPPASLGLPYFREER